MIFIPDTKVSCFVDKSTVVHCVELPFVCRNLPLLPVWEGIIASALFAALVASVALFVAVVAAVVAVFTASSKAFIFSAASWTSDIVWFISPSKSSISCSTSALLSAISSSKSFLNTMFLS